MSETAVTAKRRSQALALPNLLTYGRVVAVPVVAGLLLSFTDHWARWTALGIFIAAAVTDFLDGYFARIGSSTRRSAGCSIRLRTSCSWRPP